MWQRKRLLYLLLAGGGTTLLAVSCADYLTGQLEEPSGPLQLTRLTLFDASSRSAPLFTDTSIPDCSKNQNIDCTSSANSDSLVCRVCYNDVIKDKYTPAKSPPSPDSGQDMRVVFNKVPLLLNGEDLGTPENLAKAVELTCSGCGGMPPLLRVLQITGSNVSFDPTQVAYGPSLQLRVDPADPRSALEPGTSYQVKVNPGVAGRDGQKVDLQNQTALLAFQTEPFRILQVGSGDRTNDKWVYTGTSNGEGTSTNPYAVADLPQNATVALRFNAPLFAAGLKPVIIKASINSGAATVDVKLGLNNCKLVSGKYVQDTAHVLYLIPNTVDRQWPLIANEVTLSIPAAAIKDVVQTTGFPVGTHSVAGDLVVSLKLTGKPAATSFSGVTTDAARAATDCMPVMMSNPDGGTMDLGPPSDLAM